MKTIVLAALAVVAGVAAAADAPKECPPELRGIPTGRPLTPEEMEKYRPIFEKRRYQVLGGDVVQPVVGKVLRIVCATKYVDLQKLKPLVEEMQNELGVPVEAAAANADTNAVAVVTLTDEDSNTALLIAPEDVSAKVYVKVLMRDAPEDEKFMVRVFRETWRAMAMALGGGYADRKNDVMSYITDPRQLDGIKSGKPSPAIYNRMVDTSRKRGIGRLRTVTYRQACMEGWAPEPKDDVQRKIRDEVAASKKEAPTKPMKIKFDPAKDK